MIIRSSGNCHRYIRFQNNRIVTFVTHEKDPTTLSGLGKGLFYGLAALVGVCGLLGGLPAFAELPTGYATASGSATFQNDGTQLTITASNKAIINYSTFNIGQQNSVNIISPLSLHRVAAGNPSQILGTLNSTGKLFLVNPSGIFFGAGSRVNVQGLVASTLGIKDADFLAGNFTLSRANGQAPASIVNHGRIQATESVALLGSAIDNAGDITAPQVQIAVGDQVSYHVNPELGIDTVVDESLKTKVENYQHAIQNSGTITAQQVKLQAQLAQAFYETTVNNTGIIKAVGFTQGAEGVIIAQAHSADAQSTINNSGQLLANGNDQAADGGHISLESDTTTNSGLIQAASTADSGIGGTVSMLGTTVMNQSGSHIDVSGQNGGGTALIGGDYQGKNAEVRNANYNYLAQDATITANAGEHGNGGKVILWANEKTIFHGDIEAKGGRLGGNGGLVETSGKNVLQALGRVDASASQGQAGQWLLDPNNITIQDTGSDTNISPSGGNPDVFTSTDDSAIVTTSSINAALNTNTDVTIQTANAGAHTQGGDITLSNATILKSAGADATLTLKASRSILSSGTNSITSNHNKLNVVLNADTDQGSDSGEGGAIALTNTTITSNGGDITLGGGADPTANAAKGTSTTIQGIKLYNSTLNSETGNILLRGQGYAGTVNESHGVFLDGAAQVKSTTGDISVYGRAGAGVDYNRGVQVSNTNSQITTEDGAITVEGRSDGVVWYNYGVSLDSGGQINSTGSGTIHVTGISNSSGVGGYGTGVNLEGVGGQINSVDGDITVDGTGEGPGTVGHGVRLYNGGQINSTGLAKINITGTATTGGSDDNVGVSVYGSTSKITSVDGDITIGGTGGSNGQNNHGILVDNGAQISSTGTAKIDITGQASTTGSRSNNGIQVTGASKITSLNGDMTIDGTAGGTASDNHGIYLGGGSQISSTGTAKIHVIAQGSTTGTDNNQGLAINGTGGGINTKITSVTGDVTIEGTGGGSDYSNQGILLNQGGQITSTGAAKLDITGQGSTSGSYYNHGVHVDNSGSKITSATGDITINGTGGGDATDNYGVYVSNAGEISSTNTAKLNITGQGSTSGSYYNHGVYLADIDGATHTSGKITSANGDVTIEGTGGGTGSDNYGVALSNGSQISSTGTAQLAITGAGSTTGTSNNDGIFVSGSDYYNNSSKITSATGDITVKGTGHGTGSDNYGVYVASAGAISSTGAAKVNVTGQGSTAGSDNNYGVYVTDTNSQITSRTGDMTIDGTGGGTGDFNYGVFLESGGKIAGTDTAKVNVTGVGSTAGGRSAHGVHLKQSSQITSVNGDITVDGTSGGSTFDNNGVFLTSNSQIISTGTAQINVTGQVDTTAASGNNGVTIYNGGKITSVTGDITINGTGNGITTDNNGVSLASGGQITSTGAAKIKVTGQGSSLGTNNNRGIVINGTSTQITSANGNITLNGTGHGTGTDNDGVNLSNAGAISSTGTAKLNITGQGSTSGTNNNHGIAVSGSTSQINSVNGNVVVKGTGGGTSIGYGILLEDGGQISSTGAASLTLTGVAGSGSGSYGIKTLTGSNLIGSNTMTGNLTLSADTVSLSNVQLRTGGALLTLMPYSTATSIGINSGAGTLSADTFLSALDTTTVSPGKLIIGNATAGTGAVTIGTGWDLSGHTFPMEVYGGSISTGSIDAGSNSLLMRALNGNLTIRAGSFINSTATSDALVLIAKERFLNQSDDLALNVTGSGRWLVYADDSKTSQEGGLMASRLYGSSYANRPPDTIPVGSYFIYADTPTFQTNTLSPPLTGSQVPYLLNPIQSPNTVIPNQFFSSQGPLNQWLSGFIPSHSNWDAILENHGPATSSNSNMNFEARHKTKP